MGIELDAVVNRCYPFHEMIIIHFKKVARVLMLDIKELFSLGIPTRIQQQGCDLDSLGRINDNK